MIFTNQIHISCWR